MKTILEDSVVRLLAPGDVSGFREAQQSADKAAVVYLEFPIQLSGNEDIGLLAVTASAEVALSLPGPLFGKMTRPEARRLALEILAALERTDVPT